MLDKAAILVYNIPVDEIVTCGSGGTGRRARLRGVWFTPYGFKSRFPHKADSFESAFSFRSAGVPEACFPFDRKIREKIRKFSK